MIKKTNIKFKGIVAGLFSLMTIGCAFQSDVTDLHLEVDQMKEKMAQISLKLDANDRVIRDKSQSSTKEQGDAFLKLDQLGVDLQTVQGRIEENNHSLADISQKIDELSLRVNDQNAKLGMFENRMTLLEKSAQSAKVTPQEPSQSDQGIMILPGKTQDASTSPSLSIPPQDAYNLAYNDYVKGNYDLALLGFQNFMQQFPTSFLIPNAYYWLGESYFSKKDYSKAIENFDKVARDFPKHDKVASSILKEGYAYIEMGEKPRGKAYLKKVIEQFPRSNEANLAKEKLASIK
ncbi:MAG: tol-pal system protein YbgF [Nitrospiria bacterium]